MFLLKLYVFNKKAIPAIATMAAIIGLTNTSMIPSITSAPPIM